MHVLKSQDYCTIQNLVEVKKKIESKIPSVYIDVSRRTVLNSIESFPEIFDFSENKIQKKQDSDVFFEDSVIDYFDFDLEDSIKTRVTSLLMANAR